MEIHKLQQLSVTLCFVIASIGCCLTYDVLKAIRSIYPLKGTLEGIVDIAFWVICTVIIYVCLYFSNRGDIRWFELLGIIAGITIYIAFVSKYSYKIILKVVKISIKFFGFIFKILCIPCKFLHILIMPAKNITQKSKAVIYYVFHMSYQKILNKTKSLLIKIKRNWNINLTIIHFTIFKTYYIIFK